MILIGEKINASVKKTREAIAAHDAEYLKGIAQKQVAAGADYLDVNVGTGKDEVENIQWVISEIESVVSVPLAIDTVDEAVLAAGLQATTCKETPFINSISAEEGSLRRFLPYVKEYRARVVALAMGKGGVPKDMGPRLQNCAVIWEECQKAGIPPENIFFDPLLLPQATDQTAVCVTLETIERIKADFPGAQTCLGLSNVSFGLPLRKLVNATFLAMAAASGLDAVILDPLDQKLTSTIKAARMLIGKDKFCKGYIKAFRAEELVY